MFRCNWCEEVFSEPKVKSYRVNLDGEHGWWTHVEEFCPRCGEQDFDTYEGEEPADEPSW